MISNLPETSKSKRLIIPSAVQEELLRFAPTQKKTEQLFQAKWISVQKPSSLIELPKGFEIDRGEWEALSVALEIKAELVVNR